MRSYGRVFSKFWQSRDIRELSEDGRLLALYLLTCPHGNLAGVFCLPDGYAADDLKWTPERVAKGFDELSRNPFARRCESTKWVWLCKFLLWNPPENANQLKAARKIVATIPPDCCWRFDFQQVSGRAVGLNPVPEQKSLGTLSQGSRTLELDMDLDLEQEMELEQHMDAAPKRSHTPSAGNGSANGKSRGNGHVNGHGPPPEPAEPPTFALIRTLYPTRSGSHRWADALVSYTEQLKLGYTEQQMLEGTKRYAAYCRAENIEGQATVQSARVFFGPNRGFLEPWEVGKRMNAADRWLRDQEAKDANH